MISKRFELNKADLQSQAKSAFIFLAPSILAFLTALTPAINGITTDTTQKLLIVIVIKYVLDQATGIVRKFVAGKPQ